MTSLTVSVLLPVYSGDRLEHLSAALDSVLVQTKKPDQIVVVVDGPVDEAVLQYLTEVQLKNPIIDVFTIPKNVGLPSALNFGLSQVKCEWIARFDADDLMLPNRIKLQTDFVAQNRVDVLGGQIVEFDEKGILKERRVPNEADAIRKMLPWRNPINHVTVMYKAALIKHHRYRDMPGYEDYDLWYRLLSDKNIVFKNINERLVDVRAGSAMYRRRVGIIYAVGEIRFRMATSKYSENRLKHWTAGILRAFISLAPKNVKALGYKKFLRKDIYR